MGVEPTYTDYRVLKRLIALHSIFSNRADHFIRHKIVGGIGCTSRPTFREVCMYYVIIPIPILVRALFRVLNVMAHSAFAALSLLIS